MPFNLDEIKENFTINTNTTSNISKDVLNQAFNAHTNGNIKEAIESYQYLISQGFNDPRVYLNYGSILKNLGKLEEAELIIRKGIELNPNFAMGYFNLGIILIDLSKPNEAELATREGIKLNPNFAIGYFNLGIILKTLGKMNEAVLAINKAIELNPNHSNSYFHLGTILNILGQKKEAEIEIKKAIKINPNFLEAYINLGIILRDLGKIKEAILVTRRAIEVDPNIAESYSNLGSLLVDLGNLDEAEIAMNKAITINPNNMKFKSNLISLLSIYKPCDNNSNQLYIINEEFNKINLSYSDSEFISDIKVMNIYRKGLEIYKKHNLSLETDAYQIYRSNEINLNCERHHMVFEKNKIIPAFCFNCYKVQIETNSIIEFIKIFLVFNRIKLENNNTRKCMVELRPNIPGFYKGLIYCSDLNEAYLISNQLDNIIQKNVRSNLQSIVKRGCSEFQKEFPEYKEINRFGSQTMEYNKEWRRIENEADKGYGNWGKSHKTINEFNLNNFLIMRNWLAYAHKIGDKSIYKISEEIIKGTEKFKYLNRSINT
ncbi:tetratricopeptide repeat protein [Prochlorococcus sp. MIT 0801]|uniref:tetratricopeptide repeat protein n=1 Tax=Prochlorococcus sp. MIT 0801 TaxID=1501269 RepID=UPI001CEDDE60|nr:tetratricopeptide repeat protein [Prochlorococcus sp. MIT 0801]